VTAAEGDAARAARLFGAASVMREAALACFRSPCRSDRESSRAAVRAALGEEEFLALWAEGRATPLEQAVRVALEPSSGT
jgi:hypothetical protein